MRRTTSDTSTRRHIRADLYKDKLQHFFWSLIAAAPASCADFKTRDVKHFHSQKFELREIQANVRFL